jgi:monofunctional biosynthetic peptidoglycan transglycosylase
MDGVAYVADFSTRAGKTHTITFQSSDFSPQFRGRLVPQAPKLDFKDIRQIGFMLADKRPGNFELKIASIAQ